MLQIINGLPENVLGVTGEGEITGNDYETVLIPALEEKLKESKKLRLLYHLGINFKGFELSAILDDAELGIKHFTSLEKIALVSDHQQINTFVKFFGYMMPGTIRIFKNASLDEATKWVCEQ